jgi:hypothetical protein
MNRTIKTLVCLSLVTAQCLAPVFAQTTSTITTVEAAPSPTAPGAVPIQAQPAATHSQGVPVSPVAVLPQVTVTAVVDANQPSLAASTSSAVVSPAVDAPVVAAPAVVATGAPVATALRVLVEKTTATGDGQRYPDEVLRVVERSHTGAAVGLMVVGLFLGAGFLPPTKENNRGSKITAYPHPLFPELAQSVSQWAAVNKPDKKFKNPLLIRPDVFLLVYSDLSDEKTSFELQASASISRKPDSGGWFTSHEKVYCGSTFNKEKMTLEQWQANDYAEVKKRMAVYSQECITTVVAALPKLLKD